MYSQYIHFNQEMHYNQGHNFIIFAISIAFLFLPVIIKKIRNRDTTLKDYIIMPCIFTIFLIFPWLFRLTFGLVWLTLVLSVILSCVLKFVRKFLPRKKTEDLQDTLEKSNTLKKE